MMVPTSGAAERDPQSKRALLAELLQERLDAARVETPLTQAQQAMWFLHQLAPRSSAYNVAFTARVRSTVDLTALRRALQALVDRHAPLRTTYTTRDGKPIQVTHVRREMALDAVAVAGWDDVALDRQINSTFRVPFDLEEGPLFRATLFTRAADDHVLLLAAHHIALDGWSVWVLLDELGACYAAETHGATAVLPALAVQYPDYVRWQNTLVAGPDGERMWDFWREQLQGELPVLDLPTDRSRPVTQTFNGATIPFDLSDELVEGIRMLARSEQTTVYAVLLAAYQVLLHRYSGQDDILVGSPMAGRNRPEFAGLVGDFINVVVLRADLSGAPTFRTFLAQVRKTVLAALEHQEYPFPLLVSRLAPKHDPSRSPVVQVGINFHNVQRSSALADLIFPTEAGIQVDVGGLLMEAYPFSQQEGQIDLMLQVIDANRTLIGRLQYNTDLFDAATIERMVDHYRMLLAGLVADPDRAVDRLPLMTNSERREVLVGWNSAETPFPADRCIQQLIEEQVERTPDRIAVDFVDARLSYRELNNRANQLAQHLIQLGAGPEALVGIYLERSLELLVALLAVHKAGGAYVPLDPTYPAARLRFMLENAGVGLLVSEQGMRPEQLLEGDPPGVTNDAVRVVNLDLDAPTIAQLPTTNPVTSVTPENLAYVIYTSGSTGQPKGIEIEHRSLVSFLYAFQHTPGMTERDVVVARTTLSFDPSIVELFLPLLTGARIALISSQAAGNGELLKQVLERSGATILQVTPSHCRLLLAAGWRGAPGLKLLVGGEPLTRDLADELLPRVEELWNIYGPTETTIWVTVARVGSVGPITVGRPIGNVRTYILDGGHQPAPPGVVGELYIGGTCLARGYRRRPDLSASSFVELDLQHWTGDDDQQATTGEARATRLYRTGDLARYLSDGSIELLGRADSQVKVRGFRIELGEIEVALTELEGVQAAVAVAREDTPGDQRLVAYIQPSAEGALSPATLRRELRQRLPSYMVPATFVPVQQFPLTPSGKIDRSALPAPEKQRASSEEQFVAPRTPTEQAVARLWCAALNVDRIGAYDNFYDLGGHSLKLVEVLAAIEQELGTRINPAIAQTQTLGQLAVICDEMLAAGEVTQPKPTVSSAPGVFGAMRRVLGSSARPGAR